MSSTFTNIPSSLLTALKTAQDLAEQRALKIKEMLEDAVSLQKEKEAVQAELDASNSKIQEINTIFAAIQAVDGKLDAANAELIAANDELIAAKAELSALQSQQSTVTRTNGIISCNVAGLIQRGDSEDIYFARFVAGKFDLEKAKPATKGDIEDILNGKPGKLFKPVFDNEGEIRKITGVDGSGHIFHGGMENGKIRWFKNKKFEKRSRTIRWNCRKRPAAAVKDDASSVSDGEQSPRAKKARHTPQVTEETE